MERGGFRALSSGLSVPPSRNQSSLLSLASLTSVALCRRATKKRRPNPLNQHQALKLYCYEGAYFLMQIAYTEAKLEMNEIVKYWWKSGVAYTAQVTQIFDNGDVQLRVPPKPQQKWVKAHTSPRKIDPVRVIVRKPETQSRIFRPPPNRGAWDEVISKDLKVRQEDVRYLSDRLRRTLDEAPAAPADAKGKSGGLVPIRIPLAPRPNHSGGRRKQQQQQQQQRSRCRIRSRRW